MDYDTEMSKRVWLAVLVQAFKDFCSLHPKDYASVVRWLGSPGFENTCDMADVDEDRVREAFRRLDKFSPAMRKKMLREIIRNAGW